MKPGLMGTPGAGDTKMGPFPTLDHSPDVLLGVVGASNQAGNQVCKAETPQGEGPPPAPQHTPTSAPGHPVPLPNRILLLIWVLPFTSPCLEGQGGMAPWSLQPLAPWHNLWCLWLCLLLGCHLTWGLRVLEGVPAGWMACESPMFAPSQGEHECSGSLGKWEPIPRSTRSSLHPPAWATTRPRGVSASQGMLPPLPGCCEVA